MRNATKFAAAAVSLVLIGGGCPGAPPAQNLKEPGVPASAEKEAAAVIEITAEGFVSKSVTIKVGETVRFVNRDAERQHWPASTVHPTHQELPGFDALRGLEKDETYAFTFMKAGAWNYHDHLNPGMKGQVVVE